MMSSINCSQLVAKSLSRAGITHMFGVVRILVTSLATRAVALGIRFIAFHNEQSANYAASAYGYLTYKPASLLTVSGPGCVYGLAGLSNIAVNTWPMVMIFGSCDQKDNGHGDFQELDQVTAVKAFVKLAVKVKKVEEIPDAVFKVISVSGSSRPGGCYLDIPADVLHQTLTELEAGKLLDEAETKFVRGDVKDVISKDDLYKAISVIRKAERPLIVFGKGATICKAEDEIKLLVERMGIPFLPTPMGKGLLPDTHELAATAIRSLVIGKCDVCFVIGARLNWLLHFGDPSKWSKDVKFVLVDIDEGDIELRNPYLGLVGDVKKVLKVLNKEIKADLFCLGRNHPWVQAIMNKAKENVLKMEGQFVKDVVPFNFLTLMRIIRVAIIGVGSPAPIVVSEGANTMDVGRSVLVQMESRTRLDAGTWGTMGVGLGYCIIVAVASPDRLVVAIEGDSGFDFNAMEVETLIRYQLLVVVIVFNNAFGGKGYLVGTLDELKSALTESFSARKPAIINVTIDPYAGAESGRMQHKN
ncbi:2-hydroxyacyl-CoA lyase [Tanacetum coccineum]